MDFSLVKRFSELLVTKGLIHEGQARDVENRGREQARHILLDKRAEMRRLLGKQRVSYDVHEIELIASFRFPRQDGDGVVDEETVSRAVAEDLGVPFRLLDPLQMDYRVVTEAFGGPFAERHLVVALEDVPGQLTLAMASPWDRELLEGIARVKGKAVKPVLATKADILRVVVEFHGFRRSMRAAEHEMGGGDLPDIGNLEGLVELKSSRELDAGDAPVVRAVNFLLNYALDQRASDIHIEPKRDEALVRMRIDGVLHRVYRMPKSVHPAVVSRLKTMSRMDIAERRRPQDGRFKTQHKNLEVELRVSTVPTAFGEKVVMRVFDPGILMQDIEKLGFFPRELGAFRRMLANNAGMILVTGPTGSGKTTTLYSALHHLSSPRVNIVTLEDPIEMIHPEFNQISMQPKIGVTFGTTLKSVLRQDPDIVMVGEIRDEETAENAVQAALTGHLVLATVHTGEAAQAVGRLLDLGALPFLLSGVLLGVVAQRLVRKVCPHCAVDEVLTEEQAHLLRIPRLRDRALRIRRGTGCTKCRFTGNLGRTALFELLECTPRISRLINDKATANEIKREALNDGMLTLRDYGIKKLAQGAVNFEEVVTVTDDLPVY